MRIDTDELLSALQDAAHELLGMMEMDIAFESEHVTEDGVKAYRRAEAILQKYGRPLLIEAHK